MISDWFLQLARCPVSHSRLRLAEDELVRRLNEAVKMGKVTNRIQRPVAEPVDQALVNEDQSLLFPVRDDIPTLIADEAIPIEQLSDCEA
jgi:uncharacterized protein YbaR (Trm112 family)